MSTSRTHRLTRFAVRLITAMSVVALAVTAVSHERARAATVSLNVTCSGSWTVYNVTAAQGDTVEVTIDSGCYNSGNQTAYGYSPSASSPSTYFSSGPTGAPITNPANKLTWVIKNTAPVGTMSGTGFSNLPYVCNNCSIGAVIKFTITAAGGGTTTTAAAPTTTTTAAPTTTTDAVTTTTGGSGGGGSGGAGGGSGGVSNLGESGYDAVPALALAVAMVALGIALSRRVRTA